MLFNVLALCATSALAGAMILIWRVLGSYWRHLSSVAFSDWIVAYGPLKNQVMMSLGGMGAVGLLASLWLDRSNGGPRLAWIGALLCLAGVWWITIACEMPLSLVFAAHSLPTDRIGAALDSWMNWHLGRVLLGLCAAVLGVVALVLRLPTPRHPGAQMRGRFYETEDARRAMRGS